MNVQHLRRLRMGVLIVVILGIAGSVVMNVLHAPPTTIAQAIAATPPLALFASIELISRIPSSNRWLSAGRIFATLTVAAVGGSISYAQQMATVEAFGFAGWQASIWPLSVDGLMFVATLSLVEVVRKIRQVEARSEVDTPAAAEAVRVPQAPPAVVRAAIPTSPGMPPVGDLRSEPYWGARLGAGKRAAAAAARKA